MARERPATVAVALVTYNSAAVLADCLTSLPDAMRDVESFRVVVADNASTDDTVNVATGYRGVPGVEVIQLGANLGYSAGINAVSSHVGPAGALLVLNPDIRLRPRAVTRMLEALEATGAGIAAPRTVDPAGHLDPSLAYEPSIRRALAEAVLGGKLSGRVGPVGQWDRRPRSYERPSRADWANGAAWLISARCREVVGPWDESFFLYAEEIDYGLRARDAGFATMLVPEATAVHLRGGGEQSPELRPLQVYNKWRVYRRRHGAALGAIYRVTLAANELLRLPRGAEHLTSLKMLALPGHRPPQLAALGL